MTFPVRKDLSAPTLRLCFLSCGILTTSRPSSLTASFQKLRCPRQLRSPGVSIPIFLPHIVDIILSRTQEKMGWIHTRGVIAVVQNKLFAWDRAVKKRPNVAVGPPRFPLVLKTPVSGSTIGAMRLRSEPNPTVGPLQNIAQKAIKTGIRHHAQASHTPGICKPSRNFLGRR